MNRVYPLGITWPEPDVTFEVFNSRRQEVGFHVSHLPQALLPLQILKLNEVTLFPQIGIFQANKQLLFVGRHAPRWESNMAAAFFRKLHMLKTIIKGSWHYFGNFHCTDRVISFRYSLLQSTCKSIYVRTAKRQTCNLKPQFDVCGKRGLPQTVQSPNAHPSNVVRESKNIFVKYGGIGSCQVTHRC